MFNWFNVALSKFFLCACGQSKRARVHNRPLPKPREETILALRELGKRVQQGQFPYKEGEELDMERW